MMWIVVFGVVFVISVITLVISAHALWEYDFASWLTPLSACVMAISLLVGVVLFWARAESKRECLAFEETKSMIISSVDNAENLENVGITDAVVKQNQWLVYAKTSVQEYGAWSLYYGLGVEGMEYISLGGS